MLKFFKISGIIAGSLLTMFVIIYLVRNGYGKSNFIGISGIVSYFENLQYYNLIDSIFKDFMDLWNSSTFNFNEFLNGFSQIHWNGANFVDVNNPIDALNNVGIWFQSLGDLFSQLGNAFVKFFNFFGSVIQFITLPIRALWFVLQWLYSIIYNLVQFFVYIANY